MSVVFLTDGGILRVFLHNHTFCGEAARLQLGMYQKKNTAVFTFPKWSEITKIVV